VSDPWPLKMAFCGCAARCWKSGFQILQPGDARVPRGGKLVQGRSQEIFRPRRRDAQKILPIFFKKGLERFPRCRPRRDAGAQGAAGEVGWRLVPGRGDLGR
jgi:hypothetical protein